ncbi:MAG: PEP-CTERM system TPR-repeat protein PrsT [Thiobacillus sp.]|nr:PEP-CTERM system TPR-repeat protein PrsT [Thiobacillus sp.]
MTQRPVALAIALAFAATALLTACDSTAKLTEQEHIQRAKDFEDKGNLKGSILELKNAVQKNPDSPQARLMLGQVYLKSGMGAEAEKELNRAVQLGVNRETIKPQLGEALLMMGEYKRVLDEIQPGEQTSAANRARILQMRAEAMLNLGQFKAGCSLFQQSLEADSSNPPTYWGLAQCAVAENNMAKAKTWLDTALKIGDKQSHTWVYLGSLELRNDNPQGALSAFTNALNLDPNNLDALAQRININLSLGRQEAARKDLDHVLKLAPKSILANYLTAVFNFQQRKYPVARDALLEVFKLNGSHAPSVLLAGATDYALGSYQQAETHLNRFLANFPGNPYARRVLAAVQLRQGHPDKSLETLAPLLSPETKDTQALALAGEAYLWKKDYTRAMDYLQHASRLNPENAAIKTQLAAGLLGNGDSERGLATLEQATRLSATPGQADLALVILQLHRKEYDQAQKTLAMLEKKLPDNPLTQNLLAAALMGKQDLAGARKALERALDLQPTFFPAASNLARLDMADNKPDAARKRFEAILNKDKNNLQAMMALADLAGAQKNESDAVNWLEKAAKADPKAITPRTSLARYYLDKKDNQKALALANEIVAQHPDSLEALNLLGATQMGMGNLAESIATFTRMARIAPQSPAPLLNLGLAQFANKQFNAARTTLQKAIQLKPDFLQALDAMIRLELADNKPDAALKIARQMQAQQPKSFVGFDREADILVTQKKYTEARKAYDLALAKGGDSTTITKIAQMHLVNGQYREAITQYESLLRASPNDIYTLNNLAVLYQKTADGRALATAEKALKLSPDNPGIMDTLGWILANQGHVPRGLALLKNAVSKAPGAADIRYHYAVALLKAGDKREAKKELAKAVNAGQAFAERNVAKVLLDSL